MKLEKEEYNLIEEFAKKLVARTEKGRGEYGMNYMKLNKKKVMREIEEELLDVAGWAMMFWMKLKKNKVI